MAEAERERAALPKSERAALINADAKLGAYGPRLGAWRALYRQVGEVFVVAAVGPEAQADPRGFDRAVQRALERLAKVEEG